MTESLIELLAIAEVAIITFLLAACFLPYSSPPKR